MSRGDPGPAELARAADTLRATFAADGPLRQTEIDKLITARLRRGVGHWLDMVRVPPSGTWERRRADLYLSADLWLGAEPDLDPDRVPGPAGAPLPGGFGPSTPAEIADWAGLPVVAVARALDRMALRTCAGRGRHARWSTCPGRRCRGRRTPVPVRFLPVWDATLLVHARRTGILPERFRPRIFNTRTPHSFNTVLVDGAVVGTWRYEHDEIRVDEFEPLDPAVRREVRTASEALAAFHR